MPKPDIDDLTTPSVFVLLQALRDHRVSALELADAAILRIQRSDSPINAVVVRDFDRARDQAKAADVAIARGERRRLLGIPMTVKEAFNVAGLATTWGLPTFKDHISNTTSVAVDRLQAAGAVILGKTNVPPFLADWQSSNPIYGRTSNPWDTSRTPGGSSGGSAAAVAAGMIPLEFGSDLGGSIRVPAAFCGVFGHKPSFGVVPMRGFAPPRVDGSGIPISVLGPIARAAADLELALEVVAGPAGDDAIGYRLVLPPARHIRPADHRVLILDHHPAAALDTEIQTALHGLADRLEAKGAKVARSSPLIPDLMLTLGCFGTMLGTITSRGGPPRPEALAAHAWMDLLDRQEMIRRGWATLFGSFVHWSPPDSQT